MREKVNYFVQQKRLTVARRSDKFLQAVHSQVLQDVAFRLDKAYERFYAGLSRHPRFKRKGRVKSFTYPQTGFTLTLGRIRLSKIGTIKVRIHRFFSGLPKRVTVVKDVDQWFVLLLSEEESPSRITSSDGKVGVDLGISNLAALSNGILIGNPNSTKKSAERIKALQRRLSSKTKGSRNREKARIALARSWRKVRRGRDDFAHKVSDKLTKENNFIVFENLNPEHLNKNHRLASAIMDAGWSKLRTLTAYKAERRGGRVILVNPAWTSQKCSGCGLMVPKTLRERQHSCKHCGLLIDRDVNAARNILKAGLERALAEEEPLPIRRRRISKFCPLKHETRGISRAQFTP